jgi:hypothetical protein
MPVTMAVISDQGLMERTGTFGFLPGTSVKYKYTAGLPQNEGKWSGTEEFPLTERGLEIPKGCKAMTVHDVFADRPKPTGTAGPLTVVDSCEK